MIGNEIFRGYFSLPPIRIMQWRVETAILNTRFYTRSKSKALGSLTPATPVTLHNGRNFNHATINISIAMRQHEIKSWA